MKPLDFNTVALEPQRLADINQRLATLTAEQRIDWALAHLPGEQVLSSSFGAQAAVSLHMVTVRRSDVPVVLVDTGYLFPQTWEFVRELSERLRLNLHTYRAAISPVQMEARYGELWMQGRDLVFSCSSAIFNMTRPWYLWQCSC